MTEVLLLLADTSTLVAGRPVTDHLVRTFASLGPPLRIVHPDAPLDGPAVLVDGRFVALTADDVAPLLDATSGVVLAPSGQVVAACQHFRGAAGTCLEGAAGDPVGVLSPDSATRGPAAERVVRARYLQDLERQGVHFVDPNGTLVDTTVTVSAGVVLWPGVVLRGSTVLAPGVEVQSGCWVEDTVVGAGASLKPYCVCTGATIGERASVGPFAHLRAKADLGADTRVGNFVEVKNTRLHPGAKASHLAYLGDAEVGAHANVGAGTITCNFDGYGKYKTTIGAGAFIGSNSALVAPVTIGEGAIVGAGSVVTGNVPDEALFVERAAPRTLVGHAPRLRARNAAKAGKTP